MKANRNLLLAGLFMTAALSLNAQQNGQGRGNSDPRIENPAANPNEEGKYAVLARERSEQLAREYDITNNGKKNQLLKACGKFYEALALLDAEFGDVRNGVYQTKYRELDQAFSRELQKILPQS